MRKDDVRDLCVAYQTVTEYVYRGWWDRLPVWIALLRRAQKATGVIMLDEHAMKGLER